ncbi:hypothetical protein ACJJTC_011414 [Scirpophaga incertulas]
MASCNLGMLSNFDHNVQTWKMYKCKLTQWFIANDITAGNDPTGVKKRAILLSALSESTFKLATDLALPKEIQDVPFKDIIILLDKHFTPMQDAGLNVNLSNCEKTCTVEGTDNHGPPPTDLAAYVCFVLDGSLPVTGDELRSETEKDRLLTKVIRYTLAGWPNKISDSEMRPYHASQLVFGRKLRSRLDLLSQKSPSMSPSCTSLADHVHSKQCSQTEALGGGSVIEIFEGNMPSQPTESLHLGEGGGIETEPQSPTPTTDSVIQQQSHQSPCKVTMTRGVRRPPTLEDDDDDEFVDAHSSESSDAAAGMEINLEKERSKRARPPVNYKMYF